MRLAPGRLDLHGLHSSCSCSSPDQRMRHWNLDAPDIPGEDRGLYLVWEGQEKTGQLRGCVKAI